MARIRPDRKHKKRKKATEESQVPPEMAQPLADQAIQLLHAGQPQEALGFATKALSCLQIPSVLPTSQIPILELFGEIYIELGDAEHAKKKFFEAASLDPEAELQESEGGGADKFLWLAQLCEEGGQESIDWFEKGMKVLRKEISLSKIKDGQDEADLQLKKRKLAQALCGATEVYMTDLSWEDDAEERCESYIIEACMVSPDTPETLQTLASVRISQTKLEEAQSALDRSLRLWIDLEPESPIVPDFPTKISLSRLLMEAEMEEKASDVLDRLVSEDDTSVEAWYLGGWCYHLLAAKLTSPDGSTLEQRALLKHSRKWLLQSLKLYDALEYEDGRLKGHAVELLKELDQVLGQSPEDDADEDEGWEDEDDEDGIDEDEIMKEI